jgi:hypothetical protein
VISVRRKCIEYLLPAWLPQESPVVQFFLLFPELFHILPKDSVSLLSWAEHVSVSLEQMQIDAHFDQQVGWDMVWICSPGEQIEKEKRKGKGVNIQSRDPLLGLQWWPLGKKTVCWAFSCLFSFFCEVSLGSMILVF